jgi:mannose/fructose/N-acetylgalactosamine-specific phosphotransferase system component IIC
LDLLTLTLLGGLLALDGTSVGQFMVSRPLVAGVLTGWMVGDPALGLLIGGILEVYFISIFPVGGAEFPEGGPPTLVAVAVGATIPGPAGVALGVGLALILSRLGARSIRLLRRVTGHLTPDPARFRVTTSRIVWAHAAGIGVDFCRGCLLSLIGLWAGLSLAPAAAGAWPLQMPGTLTLLAIGASLPAGAFVGSLGGWKKRGILFLAGAFGFFLASVVL